MLGKVVGERGGSFGWNGGRRWSCDYGASQFDDAEAGGLCCGGEGVIGTFCCWVLRDFLGWVEVLNEGDELADSVTG